MGKKGREKFDLDAWLEWLQKPGPKVVIARPGKPDQEAPYTPMSKEKAQLIKATFEHEGLQTKEMRLHLSIMDKMPKQED